MADSTTLPSELAERLKRLDKALDSLDRAMDTVSTSSPGLAQTAALSELQGRVGRLVAYLEKAVGGSPAKTGATHAAD